MHLNVKHCTLGCHQRTEISTVWTLVSTANTLWLAGALNKGCKTNFVHPYSEQKESDFGKKKKKHSWTCSWLDTPWCGRGIPLHALKPSWIIKECEYSWTASAYFNMRTAAEGCWLTDDFDHRCIHTDRQTQRSLAGAAAQCRHGCAGSLKKKKKGWGAAAGGHWNKMQRVLTNA